MNGSEQSRPSPEWKATLQNYLANYAEPEATATSILEASSHQYQYVICIPFYNEPPDSLNTFFNSISNENVLLIAVVNQPSSQTEPSPENTALCRTIDENAPLMANENNLKLYEISQSSHILLVDRFSQNRGIPIKKGVGLARKIAADIAASLIAKQIVKSHWIFCTDADASLPVNYFSTSKGYNPDNCGALIYPYKHLSKCSSEKQQTIQKATELYELGLRQYENGLREAGSSYAYQTLGSTLCISAYYYAVVRGFPRRNAAEDFYILNKIQKTGGVVCLDKPAIALQSRLSTRAPFGTGIAVSKLVQSADMHREAIFYHPGLFLLLEILLGWFRQLSIDNIKSKNFAWNQSLETYACESPLLTHPVLLRSFGSNKALDRQSSDLISKTMINSLNSLGMSRCIDHCLSQCASNRHLQRHFCEWFDAFRTLKWLHLVRKQLNTFKNINYLQLTHANRGK